MTYRSVFVHVDDTEACARRVDYAARMAKRYPGELLGAYIVPPSDVTAYTKAAMPPDMFDKYMARLAEVCNAAEADFRAAARRAGVEGVEWRTPKGNRIGQAVLHARHADLAIIGQPARDDTHESFAAELANAVITHCGRPVLLVPSVGEYPTVGERVLIAWKDSRESARAVADALPLLKDAKKVFAIAITPEADETARETFTDAQLAAFLRRHEVDATVRRIFAADINAGELLLSQAADVGADLIVMGAYSRSWLSALAWGSVTRVMMSSMTAPVLMSH
jgi:nucleotide-binding universal stress UspA family protein